MKKQDWHKVGEKLKKEMENEQPPVQIEKIMKMMQYASKSSAEYALRELKKIGVVKWVDGKWYLA